MAYAGDPVGAGVVRSLARPEGNVTGLSSTAVEISGKRIELLREVIPGLARIGLLINGADPFAKPLTQETLAAGKRSGVAVDVVDVRRPEDLAPALVSLKKAGAGAVIVQGSLNAPAWPQTVIKHGLAGMGTNKQTAAAGALMYFGADADDLVVRGASYVHRILKGAKPAELPIEQPTRMELILNRKTAKAVGIVFSQAFLVRADAVID